MVAIVLPCPLPHSIEQEALLYMPKGQEAWLTSAEPSEQHKNTRISHILKQTNFLYYFVIFCIVIDNWHLVLYSSQYTHCACEVYANPF